MKEYITSDFYSACILRACNVPITDIFKTSKKTVAFSFSDRNNECSNLLDSHWDRQLNIPSKDLLDAISELKTRMCTVLSNDKAN